MDCPKTNESFTTNLQNGQLFVAIIILIVQVSKHFGRLSARELKCILRFRLFGIYYTVTGATVDFLIVWEIKRSVETITVPFADNISGTNAECFFFREGGIKSSVHVSMSKK